MPGLLLVKCRVGECGACCIVPAIDDPYPGHPDGKPAGVRCANLTDDHLCSIWGDAAQPEVCRTFHPVKVLCGDSEPEAMWLLEFMTQVGVAFQRAVT